MELSENTDITILLEVIETYKYALNLIGSSNIARGASIRASVEFNDDYIKFYEAIAKEAIEKGEEQYEKTK